MTNVVEETEVVALDPQGPEEAAPLDQPESGPVSEAVPETPATDGAAKEEQSQEPALPGVAAPLMEALGMPVAPLLAPEEYRTAIREWLAKDDDLPRYEKFEAPGLPHPIWIERLDWEGFTRVGFLAATNKEGAVAFGRKGDLQRLGTAMFFVALHADEEGKINLFGDPLEAQEVICSKNVDRVRLNIKLFSEIMRINPQLMEIHPDAAKDELEGGA